MGSKKFLLGIFGDEDVLLNGVPQIREKGIKIHDIFTPFPIHGLDTVMGLRESKLHIGGFIYGITGTSIALGFITWANTFDWRVNFGGKPFWALPAYIPITFELTVLCASAGMVATFMYLCRLAPGVQKHIMDLRQTDNKMVVAIEVDEHSDEASITNILKQSGAEEVNTKVIEDWYKYKLG
ncbi:MAG: hypothetical protein RL065_1719 [Bacteroidota bacterium]|jgi:hypothetical protein